MTVPNNTLRETYLGNGVQTVFPYGFKIYESTEIVVTVTDLNGNNPDQLVLGSTFTVSGVGKQAGGSVTFVGSRTALLATERVVIERLPSLLQETNLKDMGQFSPETHEDNFDRDAMKAQYLDDRLDRALSRPSYGIAGASAFDAESNTIDNLGTPTLSHQAVPLGSVEGVVTSFLSAGQAVVPMDWTGTGDGADTTFTVTGATLTDPVLYDVFLDGVHQQPTTDYTIDLPNSEVVFTTAPGNGTAIYVRQTGYARGGVQAPTYTTGGLPTASASLLLTFAYLKDASSPGRLLVCLETSAGAYQWAAVAMATS